VSQRGMKGFNRTDSLQTSAIPLLLSNIIGTLYLLISLFHRVYAGADVGCGYLAGNLRLAKRRVNAETGYREIVQNVRWTSKIVPDDVGRSSRNKRVEERVQG
jgi:hypothetical protein